MKVYRAFIQESFNRIQVGYHTFEVIKHTRCGVWIIDLDFKNRFINLSARKQYAYTSREKAFENLKARTKRRQEILTFQLDDTKEKLNFINSLTFNESLYSEHRRLYFTE